MNKNLEVNLVFLRCPTGSSVPATDENIRLRVKDLMIKLGKEDITLSSDMVYLSVIRTLLNLPELTYADLMENTFLFKLRSIVT